LRNFEYIEIFRNFDIVTKLFTQLVTIHGITNDGWVFPLVYALLPDKKASSYKCLFEQLRPDMVLLDFERATMRAIREVCPDVELQGCHFHFTQSLYRNFSEKIKKEYKDNGKFAIYMKRYFALAFVHPDQVVEAFDNIIFQLEKECFFET
jgi:hypothetical protein